MRRTLTLALVVAAASVGCVSAWAAPHRLTGNQKCWGMGVRQAPIRNDITCRSLTEALLVGLEGATPDQVVEAMGVTGRPVPDGLHFLSNNLDRGGYNGDINFKFTDGRVDVIFGFVNQNTLDGDGPKVEFIWNAHMRGCSDFPGSNLRCNEQ